MRTHGLAPVLRPQVTRATKTWWCRLTEPANWWGLIASQYILMPPRSSRLQSQPPGVTLRHTAGMCSRKYALSGRRSASLGRADEKTQTCQPTVKRNEWGFFLSLRKSPCLSLLISQIIAVIVFCSSLNTRCLLQILWRN